MGKLDPYRVITVRLKESRIRELDELADGRGRPEAVCRMLDIVKDFETMHGFLPKGTR